MRIRLRVPMILQLQIIAIAKNRLIPFGNITSAIIIIFFQCHANFTTSTTTQDNQPLIQLLQQIMVNSRLIIHSLQIGARRQLHQIMEARIIHCQHSQVKTLLIFTWIAIKSRTSRHVSFNSDNRLNSRFFGGLVIVQNTTHRAVIGYGGSLHSELFNLIDQVMNLSQSVQHRVKSVIMKMHEI